MDDTLQQKDQGTSPSKKGTEREGWEPIEVEGELHQEGKEKGISEQTAFHKHTHTKMYASTHVCTHTEVIIALTHILIKRYTHTIQTTQNFCYSYR